MFTDAPTTRGDNAESHSNDGSRHGALHRAPRSRSPSVILRSEDATGRDCGAIGSWDLETRTCTLTTDVAIASENEAGILIESNGIVIDGGGHRIAGPGWDKAGGIGVGAMSFNMSGITIENVIIDGFGTGITFFYGATGSTIRNVSIINANSAAIYVRDGSSGLKVIDSEIRGTCYPVMFMVPR